MDQRGIKSCFMGISIAWPTRFATKTFAVLVGKLLCLSSFFHSGLVCLCSLKNSLQKVISCRQMSSHRGQTAGDLRSTVDCWPRGAAVCTIVMLPVWNTMECLCLAPYGVAVRSVRFPCATWTSSRSAVLCHAPEHGYPSCERRCRQRSDRLHGARGLHWHWTGAGSAGQLTYPRFCLGCVSLCKRRAAMPCSISEPVYLPWTVALALTMAWMHWWACFSWAFKLFDVLTSLVCRSTSGCLESFFFRSIQCK